jgi:hypothetical protein
VRRELLAEVTHWLAGRFALREGADQLRDLDAELPYFSPLHLAALFPDCSPQECYCRQLMELVKAELDDPRFEQNAVVTRLEKELQILRERGLRKQPKPNARPPNPV